DVRTALDRYAEAVNICCAYAKDRSYDLKFALEPKPNEPRGDMFLPTVGHAIAFINELQWPEMVGLNPEFAHETMSGLNFTHAVAQTLWHGKLFHIDLNAQRYLVKLLEDSKWDGMLHFDAHAYRTENAEGVWDFARGCMRTYLILAEKSRQFKQDKEIQAALKAAMFDKLAEPTSPDGYGADALHTLRTGTFDVKALGERGYAHERLDQLVTELLLGVR
ncbi:MAG: hypothetical protein RI976_1412, partial [Actinomycetota bacterium]